jgi:GH18 family chitinase
MYLKKIISSYRMCRRTCWSILAVVLSGCSDGSSVTTNSSFNVDAAVTSSLNASMPANKIIMGVPFYGRGWARVSAGYTSGLYQSAGLAAYGIYDSGVNDYKELKKYPGSVFYDPTTLQMWKYDAPSRTFWTYDDTQVVGWKASYATDRGLGGLMAWSLDGDDNGELLTAMRNAMPNKKIGGYFIQWGIYARNFLPSALKKAVQEKKIDYIQYAFGNIYEKNGGYECAGDVQAAEVSTTEAMPDKATASAAYQSWLDRSGKGGDRWADVGRPFSSLESVDGVADQYVDKLGGNWNQLKKLKVLNPNLKVYISLGGWTYSKFFSKAVATAALRRQLVSSCIDLYIKGNVSTASDDARGGMGVASGVFDGIDIDWEAPGVNTTQPYNNYDPVNDKNNYTLLLKEFRTQLDVLTSTTGKKYDLSVAVLTGDANFKHLDITGMVPYLDFFQLMTYDYHGTWDLSKTGFAAPVYNDPRGPNQGR